MKKMTSEEIIRTYIDYFKANGHTEVESASLIPHNDPSILWINAGVTPLKKYFDGTEIPSNRRLVSCQKCIRTGDIESVGKTARHHTFFQMLGNFSIGDYFKKEALTMAFELLTSPEYFGFDINKLYVTVYPDDIEANNLWASLGILPDHIIKLENNYWEIGEGPSGPDSEIFYDRGEKYDPDKLGVKLLQDEIENDRYIEIWNNVFSQFNAKAGIPRNEYEELPSKNIDTGMGVERMACIIQETETNYETDLFMPIMEKISELSQIMYTGQMEFKVIADHVRTLVFAISDGATFENYGRGYVLRRLLRRAVRMGKKLNIGKTFISELVDVVIDKYSSVYPDLMKSRERVKELTTKEEELFQKTLISGEKRLEEIFNNSDSKVISGKDAFKLYDTYGFPIDLTCECASEHGFTVDTSEFEKYMSAQKEMARSSRKDEASMNLQNEALINYKEESKFIGYDSLENKTKVIGIIKDNEFVDTLSGYGYVVLEENPFYAESGGQVADTGYLKGKEFKADVIDVIKAPNKQHLLYVNVFEGTINKEDEVITHVLNEKRHSIERNHSGVHLLHKSLQQLLGSSVLQAGSKVDENSFRLDFTYHGRLSDEIIVKLEGMVNDKIKSSSPVSIEYMKLNDAKAKGAMALFEDKYGDIVRVVSMGDSIELCGGTHVKNTKDLERFAIISVENKGADTFRIEATCADKIEPMLEESIKIYKEESLKLLEKVKKIVLEAKEYEIDLTFDFELNNKVPHSYKDVIEYKQEVDNIKKLVKDLEKEYNDKKAQKMISNIDAFIEAKEEVNGNNIIVAITNNYEVPILKQIVDAISNKVSNSFVLLANVGDNKVNFIGKCTINNDNINVGSIIKELSLKCEGNGGGSKNYGQGGGTKTSEIATFLGEIKDKIKSTM